MKIMSESNDYQILSEYESVFLKIKNTSRLVIIGNFYGDPEISLISEDEKFCVIGGEGVIIYYLNEPFEEYKHGRYEQWKEFGRTDVNNTLWVTNIVILENKRVEIETEDEQKFILDIY